MVDTSELEIYDTIIIGGGQAGLSVAYYLRKTNLNFLILDNQSKAGGAWLHTWDSLKLFSPSQYSSLSGWQMPETENEYPTKTEFLNYLEGYEKRYNFPIKRNCNVIKVSKNSAIFQLETNQGNFLCKTLVSATGTYLSPFIPQYPNAHLFQGKQIHSINYKNTNDINDKKILLIGAGNSGSQILAEVSKTNQTTWVTIDTPVFLPEDIDGRYLFIQANNSYLKKETDNTKEKISLNNIVQVESVKEGLEKGIYKDHRPFKSFYDQGVIWSNGTKEKFDMVIWCTGFSPNLKHLENLNIIENNKIKTNTCRSIDEPTLWLVGYGNWTGFASATIYGVGKTAKQTVLEIISFFKNN